MTRAFGSTPRSLVSFHVSGSLPVVIDGSEGGGRGSVGLAHAITIAAHAIATTLRRPNQAISNFVSRGRGDMLAGKPSRLTTYLPTMLAARSTREFVEEDSQTDPDGRTFLS